jgi:hypothetical protein
MLTMHSELNPDHLNALRVFIAAQGITCTGLPTERLLELLWQFYRDRVMDINESAGIWQLNDGPVADLVIPVEQSDAKIRVDRYGILTVGRKRQQERVAVALQAIVTRWESAAWQNTQTVGAGYV